MCKISHFRPPLGPTATTAETIEIKVKQNIKAVIYESFIEDEAKNKLVLKMTISQTLGDMPQDFVEITSVSPLTRRRLMMATMGPYNYLFERKRNEKR